MAGKKVVMCRRYCPQKPYPYKILSLVVMILILSQSGLLAELARSDEMAHVGENWLSYKVHQNGSWAHSDRPSIIQSLDLYSGNQLVARVYNVDPDGFILVPVLKELPPVKAYSERGWIDDSDIGGIKQLFIDVLASKLETYQGVFGPLESMLDFSEQADFRHRNHDRWDIFTQSSEGFHEYLQNLDRAPLEQAGPLLTSLWHQRKPYNNLCPQLPGGDTCVVGCAATALAQLMHYWEWPDSGVGSHTYFWYYWQGDEPVPGGWLSADFSDPYDWLHMPDSCVEPDFCLPEDSAAMAELSYEIGASINMEYGTNGSAAHRDKLLISLPHYFRYSHNLDWEARDNNSLSEWYDLIKSEIDLNRPMYYSIVSHIVVCDGYRDDSGQYEYHMNYGWGGNSTAYTTWYVFDSMYCYWEEYDLCPYEYDILYKNIYPQQETIIEACGHYLDDSQYGNGDGRMVPGERAKLWVIAENQGQDWPTVFGSLYEEDPYIYLIDLYSDYGSMQAWEKKSNQVPFEFRVDPACPAPYVATLYITFNGDYSDKKPFYVYVGDDYGYIDSIHNSENVWLHRPTYIAVDDEWHVESYHYHSSPSSWKFGGNGADYIGKSNSGDLITPPILISANSRLTFWHWMDAALDWYESQAFEGGIVLISNNGCDWNVIEPIGGYPYITSKFGTIFFADSTPVFSGSHDWQKAEFNLSGYSGVVQFMFRFGSEPYVADSYHEGWYIDDLAIESGYTTGDANEDSLINVSDAVYIINYVFVGGTPPDPLEAGDANCDETLNVSDAVWIINYVFLGGFNPGDTNGDGIPEC